MCNLIHKYNVPGPRYTSYPTVPYWDVDHFSGSAWKKSVVQSFQESKDQGISLYLHLPFCESMCTFCGCHKRITQRHELELPYIKALHKEWQLYRNLLGTKPLIKELHLGGGTPTFFSPENLQFLIEGIFKHAQKALDAALSFEGHPNNTTKAHLKALYDVGFKRVCFGVQDYNPKVQKAINRVQPFENVKQVTQWAREIGYESVGHDIIYGLPFQTLTDVQHTISKTDELRPDRLAFYSYAHVPWRKGNGQRGYRDSDLPSPEDKSLQYEWGKQQLTHLGYTDVGMDHFALPSDTLSIAAGEGSLHRNFMGYTASKTQVLIGLGASSISDSWYAFAQNVKNIEEYQYLVENDIIPIFRGHLLNQEDQVVRRHIRNLMCCFETEWTITDHEHVDFGPIVAELKELQEDDLVHIGSNCIKVTAKGRPYVRNISMAFDRRLHRKKPETQLFSMTV